MVLSLTINPNLAWKLRNLHKLEQITNLMDQNFWGYVEVDILWLNVRWADD